MWGHKMKHAEINPNTADKAAKEWAGQAWSSPSEMNQAKGGDYPHGFLDETSEGFRIWHDANAVWYWVSVVPNKRGETL